MPRRADRVGAAAGRQVSDVAVDGGRARAGAVGVVEGGRGGSVVDAVGGQGRRGGVDAAAGDGRGGARAAGGGGRACLARGGGAGLAGGGVEVVEGGAVGVGLGVELERVDAVLEAFVVQERVLVLGLELALLRE